MKARSLLQQRLDQAAAASDDLPENLGELPEWSEANARTVTARYDAYRTGRARGEPRRYFSCRAHALHFLRAVAPTKLVDGSWLYGVLAQWRDDRLRPLVTTYLEELGDGE